MKKIFVFFVFTILLSLQTFAQAKLTRIEISNILFQVMNAKELKIGRTCVLNDKLIIYPIVFKTNFDVVYSNGKIKKYDLRSFFKPESSIIFFQNRKELLKQLKVNEFIYNRTPIYSINHIKFTGKSRIDVLVKSELGNKFTFCFKKILGCWKLEKLFLRYKYSDEESESVVYYQY